MCDKCGVSEEYVRLRCQCGSYIILDKFAGIEIRAHGRGDHDYEPFTIYFESGQEYKSCPFCNSTKFAKIIGGTIQCTNCTAPFDEDWMRADAINIWTALK